MATPLDDRLTCGVIACTARQTGLAAEKVSLESRLREDLGLDGDDAGEFFEAFAGEFAVDLSSCRGSQHFSPEGIPLRLGLAILSLGIIGLAAISYSYWLAALGAAVLIFLVGYRRRRSEGPARSPVKVLDLVQAAAAGRWVFKYPDRT